ncbi:MAG: hypothetical protein ACLSDQ_04585, partial [Adlercreutzia equolifaciens]
LEEMDAVGHATSASALDELDLELALEIARLQEQRRTIAELRAEHLDPDLPVRFARILRKLAGVDSLAETSPDDRTALIVAAHLYDEKELGELERVVDTIASERLVEAMERLDEKLCALAPDAPEQERATLAAESLETLVPVIACFDAANWLRPATDRERFLDEIAFAGYNEAQQDVYDRIERGIEEIMTERAQREKAAAALHNSALVHAHQFRRGHGHGLLPRPRPAGALHGREQPRAARLRAVGHVRRHARQLAGYAALAHKLRRRTWYILSLTGMALGIWGWAFCRRSRCSSRARSCWVFRPAPSRPCSASSSSTAFPPKIEEAPSARRIGSPWPPRPWPSSPPRRRRAPGCPWPPWPSPAAGCHHRGPSTPTA